MNRSTSPLRGTVRCRPFTLIELLVVVSIIAVLAAILLPSLSKAKALAVSAQCQNQQKQLLAGIVMYSGDFDDFTPSNQPMNAEDWVNSTRNIAGAQIWGEGHPNTANYNVALGLGMLVSLKITPIDIQWCPEDRGGNGTITTSRDLGMWNLREFFGEPFQSPWTHPTLGLPWSPYGGGSNYYMEASYGYRDGDWTTTSLENRLQDNLKMTAARFADHSLTIDRRNSFHRNSGGYNVGWGDMSVTWWKAPEGVIYTKSYQGPSYPGSGNFHGGYLTYLMDEADQKAR